MKNTFILIALLFGISITSCNKEENCTKTTWYYDADGDGYGDINNSILECDQPNSYVKNSGDCDDTDNSVNPGIVEIVDNGVDDNCDGTTDECPPNTECDCNDGIDNDSDGFIDCDDVDCIGFSNFECSCNDGEDNDGDGFIDCEDSDCDGFIEIECDCGDGLDNDADGFVDCDDLDCEGSPDC